MSDWIANERMHPATNIYGRRYVTEDREIHTFYDLSQLDWTGRPVAWEFPPLTIEHEVSKEPITLNWWDRFTARVERLLFS